MKILALLTDAYGGYGGIALHNRDLLDAMCTHNAVKKVIGIPRSISRPLDPLPNKLEYRTRAAKGMGAWIRAAAREAFVNKPDIVYCAHINLLPIASSIAGLTRSPLLTALHGIEAWQPTPRRITNSATRWRGQYYAVSSYTKSRFAEWSNVSPGKIDVLPNAFHPGQFEDRPPTNEERAKLGLTGRRVVLTLGRIVSKERAKGFDEVMEVLPILKLRYPNILYVIAGEGPYRATLERKACSMGLREHVRFIGFIDEADKASLYRCADVYAMPSRGEGFGFVFLEAMASGTPVIASTADGGRDAVLDGKLGSMVDPNDPQALVQAIEKGFAAKRGAPAGLEFFALKAFEDRVHNLLDSLIAGSK